MITNFSEFNFSQSILNNLKDQGFVEPTPVQNKTIPFIMQGRDIAALAPTGTGKTGAFLLPLIERVLQSQDPGSIGFTDWNIRNFILVLLPTRELAEQVQQSFLNWTKNLNLKSVVIIGGENADKQTQALKEGVQFVFSTPGRLIDLYKDHFLDLKQVRALVFDEADRLFDMGFKDDMKFILERVPRNRQLLLFSATLNFEVLETAYSFGSEPLEISLASQTLKSDNIEDAIIHLSQDDKGLFLLSLIQLHKPKQAIVFTNFKNQVELIAAFLRKNKLPALGISSLLSQSQRQKVMSQFRAEGGTQVLVATDVAARGLDVSGVDLVINFELPQDAESYVHRIGRTGRAGEKGKAFSLVCDRDIDSLQRIENYIKQSLKTLFLEDNQILKEHIPMHTIQIKSHEDYSSNSRSNKKPPFKDNSRRGLKNSYSQKNSIRNSQKNSSHQESSKAENNEVTSSSRKKIYSTNQKTYSKNKNPQGPRNSYTKNENFKKTQRPSSKGPTQTQKKNNPTFINKVSKFISGLFRK